jgi:hypothetical protein
MFVPTTRKCIDPGGEAGSASSHADGSDGSIGAPVPVTFGMIETSRAASKGAPSAARRMGPHVTAQRSKGAICVEPV